MSYQHELSRAREAILSEDKKLNFEVIAKNVCEYAQENTDEGVLLSLIAHICGLLYPLQAYDQKPAKGFGSLAYTGLAQYRKSEMGFCLDGKKTYITNAPIAEQFLVYAANEKAGNSFFLIEKSDEGVRVEKPHHFMSLRTCPIGDLILTNVEVTPDKLIGTEGQAGLLFQAIIAKERYLVSSMILGRLRWLRNRFYKWASANDILEYYPNREAGVRLDNSLLALGALWGELTSEGVESQGFNMKAAQLKMMASEAYQEHSARIIQALGALGLAEENLFEQCYRDSAASSLYSGSNEVLVEVLSKGLRHK